MNYSVEVVVNGKFLCGLKKTFFAGENDCFYTAVHSVTRVSFLKKDKCGFLCRMIIESGNCLAVGKNLKIIQCQKYFFTSYY